MNLELVGKDLTPSETLRQRIEQKLSKFESRLGEKLVIRVSLSKDGVNFGATVHFTAKGHEFNATANGEDIVKAADEAIAKVDRQIRKAQHKGEATRKPGASIRSTIDTEVVPES